MSKKSVKAEAVQVGSQSSVKVPLCFRAVKEGRTYRVEFRTSPGAPWRGSVAGLDLDDLRKAKERLLRVGAGWLEGE